MKSELILAICCFLVCGCSAQDSRGAGVIHGTVVSQSGETGKRIKLFAEPLKSGIQFPNTRSNDRGEYRFERLPWGRYRVFASDDDAGYVGELDDETNRPIIEVSPENPDAEFRLVLPPQAGFLQIRLTNRRTGRLIRRMGLTVAYIETPSRPIMSANADSSMVVLVPPDKNLVLHIESEGYKEWDESTGRGKPIFVPSGNRLTLDVQLEPSH